MFLGIAHNKWHGIIAFLAVGIGYLLLWTTISHFFLAVLGKDFTFLILFLICVFITHHLQCWNEIRQALDPQVSEKYGAKNELEGYKNFQKDSKDDFRWFWLGIAFSWIVPLIITVLI